MTIKADLLNSTAPVSVSSVANAGGEGKTTIAMMIEAALDLLGRPSHLVDIDQGMGSLAYQRQKAKTMEWGMPEPRADEVFQRLQNRDVVFDFGANLLASGAPVVRLYSTVNDKLAAVGFRRIALVPISTNKPGAVGAAREVLRALSHMECRAVLVNRDGSDIYDADASDLNPLKLPHLSPVLQDLRAHFQMDLNVSLADALRSPPEGWRYATDRLGMWLQEFATQPFMIDVLGGDVSIVLKRLGRRIHPPLHVSLTSKDVIHDDAIDDHSKLSAFAQRVQQNGVWRILDVHGLTPNGLRAAADEIERRHA